MSVDPQLVKKLREMSGAPMMECKRALEEAGGDPDKAYTILRKRGQAAAAKKAGRLATEGLIGCYVHTGSKIAVIVEVNCETDFVARNQEFRQLAHELAMQICATDPRFIRKEDVTPGILEREREILRAQAAESGKAPTVVEQIVEGRLGKFFEDHCLYEQHYIRDQSGNTTVGELIASKIARFGENIMVRRFARFKVGEGMTKAGSEPASSEPGAAS